MYSYLYCIKSVSRTIYILRRYPCWKCHCSSTDIQLLCVYALLCALWYTIVHAVCAFARSWIRPCAFCFCCFIKCVLEFFVFLRFFIFLDCCIYYLLRPHSTQMNLSRESHYLTSPLFSARPLKNFNTYNIWYRLALLSLLTEYRLIVQVIYGIPKATWTTRTSPQTRPRSMPPWLFSHENAYSWDASRRVRPLRYAEDAFRDICGKKFVGRSMG